MRIKNLATRATKLLTGNAYMVVDNGTKVEKINYAELAKQIITEYNTQTLAGSAQSVKSALDALNSNLKSLTGYINTGSYNDIKRIGLFIIGPSVSDGPVVNTTCGLINIAFSIGTSADSTSIKQIALPVNSEDSVYFRHLVGGSWSNWGAHSL